MVMKMGADLIISYLIFNDDERLMDVKERWMEKINNLTMDDKENIIDYYEETTGVWHEQENIDINLDDVKKDFKKIVDAVFDGIMTGYRDITSIVHRGEIIFLTGGLSWGDSPTDSFDNFYKINLLKDYIFGGI